MQNIEDETFSQDGWSARIPEDGNKPVTVTAPDGRQKVMHGMEASTFRWRFFNIIKVNSLPTLCKAVFDVTDGEPHDRGTNTDMAGGDCWP